MRQLSKDNRGFTIIEVLIVLAIAGLIMLIVFLAVPALQRNSRNNARNNDASRVSSAITECLANRNGVVGECDGWSQDVNGNDTGEVRAGRLSQLATVAFGDPAYATDSVRVSYAYQCNSAGSAAETGGGTRNFAVTYQLEDGINRCLEG